MLKRLSISQFVIITSLDIDFDDGLTVLTGETGAGKSIILDALGLILGDPADVDAIRQGEEESRIEAVFEQPQDHAVWKFLSKGGIAVEPQELHVKRTIGRSGKDEILVGEASVALPFLKELGTYLVEIHGQNANQSFLAPESQMSLLDAFGAYPPGVMENVAQAWDAILQIAKDLEDERNFLVVAEREKQAIDHTVTELEKLGMKKGIHQELAEELAQLVNTKGLCELFSSVNSQLIAQNGIELSLARVARLLETQKDPIIDKMKDHIGLALEQAREAISEMQILAPTYIDVDTSGIAKVEEKLAALKGIAAERKVPPEEIFEHYEYLAARLDRIRKAPAKIKEFDVKLISANEVYRGYAQILSDERKKAAQRLSDVITAEMPPLKLPNAQVEIVVGENQNERSAHGFNVITFTARMNPGMPFSPITETASGGELSRLILAFKMILQQVQAVSTLVFDEIDTGIGGAAAAAVGSRIARLAETTQILVITHSPQVAARGQQHMHVSKKTDGTSTKSVVNVLTLEERINEVSRMLAGEELTGESQAAARTLIEEAQSAVEARKARLTKTP
ncbi:MAG: DNA repair protein RecN [Alphaproteobacteria bacterium]|nr:DNA repair protein RecN [Alphaproteobacteria bacterium]